MVKAIKKQAFTFAETLMVIITISVIMLLMISNVTNIVPDKNKSYFKKAYGVTEKTVSELVNDEILYPFYPNSIGFVNENEAEYFEKGKMKTTHGIDKFCNLFMSKLNTLEAKLYKTKGVCTFKTTDGIYWEIYTKGKGTTSFSSAGGHSLTSQEVPNDPNVYALIKINTKGHSNVIEPATNKNCRNRENYRIYVLADGKMEVPDANSPFGDCESQCLKSHTLKTDNRKK